MWQFSVQLGRRLGGGASLTPASGVSHLSPRAQIEVPSATRGRTVLGSLVQLGFKMHAVELCVLSSGWPYRHGAAGRLAVGHQLIHGDSEGPHIGGSVELAVDQALGGIPWRRGRDGDPFSIQFPVGIQRN